MSERHGMGIGVGKDDVLGSLGNGVGGGGKTVTPGMSLVRERGGTPQRRRRQRMCVSEQ